MTLLDGMVSLIKRMGGYLHGQGHKIDILGKLFVPFIILRYYILTFVGKCLEIYAPYTCCICL